jgi:hypothetical protein
MYHCSNERNKTGLILRVLSVILPAKDTAVGRREDFLADPTIGDMLANATAA